jgi:serine/threonine protein kinase
MGYPGSFAARGMGMNGVGNPMFQNGMNGHATNSLAINERQNSGSRNGSRCDIPMKQGSGAAGVGGGVGGRPMGSSLPLLPGMGDFSPKYPVPPHMMPHNFANNGGGAAGGEVMSGGGNNSSSSDNGGCNDFNDGDIFTIKLDEDELERKMREEDAVVSGAAAYIDRQNGCNVNTPPLMTSDDETGLTPTPPTLRYLSSYEEEEVKEYMPNVYFGGTDQCKKIHAVRGADNNDGFDDENFHYRVVVGDHLLYRYEVLKVLGQGTFGIVVRAIDHKLHSPVAIKIIKNKPNYNKQAQEEIRTLELLNSDDPEDEANIVQLLDSCIFRNHYLLIFELLPSDLYALIQANKFRPMSRDFIYELSEQLLTALVHVRKHRIVHCDLKPENIMISEGDGASSEPADFALKLIDFGSACEESRPLFTYIQSRYYRAPEIVLGIPYTTAIDMWSFGCVLCELANGYPIFPASSEGELLERIVEYFGPIPSYLVRQGRRSDRFFEGDKMKYNLGKKRAPHPPNSRSLHNFLKVGHSNEDRLFENFVGCCLRLDAKARLTPEAALEHPWMEQWRSCSTGSGLSDLSDSSAT